MLEPFRGCQGLWGCAVLTRQHAFWAFLAFAVVAFQILYKSFYKVLSKSCVTCVTVAFIYSKCNVVNAAVGIGNIKKDLH